MPSDWVKTLEPIFMVIVMVGFYKELIVVFKLIAVAVGVIVGNNHNNVDNPPNATNIKGEQLDYTRHVVFGVKPMDTKYTEKYAQ
jgi:hypothetical protein